MITELRRYSVLAGRMPDMHARMRDMLMPLFAHNGVPTPIAAWECQRGGALCTFTWILTWPNFDERRSTWMRFRPIWEAARAARGGDEFVTRTELTLIDAWPDHPLQFAPSEGVCEQLWLAQPRVGHGGAFRKECLEYQFNQFKELGALSTAACDLTFGALPQALIIVSWPSHVVRSQAMTQLSHPIKSPVLAQSVGTQVITQNGIWESIDRADYLRFAE